MAYHYRAENREPGSLPRIDCVTGNLGIKFIKPTPMGVTLTLRAKVEGEVGRKTRVICEVFAGDVLTAVGDSVFVRVDTGQLADAAHGRKAKAPHPSPLPEGEGTDRGVWLKYADLRYRAELGFCKILTSALSLGRD